MTTGFAGLFAEQNTKGLKMRYFAILLLALLASPGFALTPNEVRERYTLIQRGECVDRESGEAGYCFFYQAPDRKYVVFVQNGVPILVRHVLPGQPYETVWRSRPLGLPL